MAIFQRILSEGWKSELKERRSAGKKSFKSSSGQLFVPGKLHFVVRQLAPTNQVTGNHPSPSFSLIQLFVLAIRRPQMERLFRPEFITKP